MSVLSREKRSDEPFGFAVPLSGGNHCLRGKAPSQLLCPLHSASPQSQRVPGGRGRSSRIKPAKTMTPVFGTEGQEFQTAEEIFVSLPVT